MQALELMATALALSLDAVAAAAAAGSMLTDSRLRQALRVGACFGLFQALMPAIGLTAGRALRQGLLAVDHWASFGLLTITGIGMIREERRRPPDAPAPKGPVPLGRLVLLGVATSLDAMAVGVSLAMAGGYEVIHSLVIGLTTFALCVPAVLLGAKASRWMEGRAGTIGGGALVLMGIKMLAGHLFKCW